MKKKSIPNLISQNKYLASPELREKLTLISVCNSCQMEGITCTELKNRLKEIMHVKLDASSKKVGWVEE